MHSQYQPLGLRLGDNVLAFGIIPLNSSRVFMYALAVLESAA